MAVRAAPTQPLTSDAESVLVALDHARERTLGLVAHLPDERLEAQLSPIMSPLAWDLAHIAAYEDLWICHRHGGEELLRADLAAVYDAFETPRAVRGEVELLDAAAARGYLAAVRARSAAVIERAGAGDGVICEMVVRHELQHGETMLQTLALAGLLEEGSGSAGAPCRPQGSGSAGAPCRPQAEPLAALGGEDGWVELPPGRFEMGAGPEGFSYDNERPRHEVELAGVRDRPPAGDERDLAHVRRGRRLRTPRVVVRRGLGLEGGVRHRRPSRRGGGRSGGPRLPRELVRGRRLRSRARRATPHRGTSGSGRRPGSSGRQASARSGSGPPPTSSPTPGSRPIPTASTRRCSSASATACCAGARGPRTRASRPPPSATGTCPSGARSSPACGWHGTVGADGVVSAVVRAGRERTDDHDRLASGRLLRALTRRRRARRAHAPVQGAAAEALLRRPRRRAVRSHLRAARVLPHARRARDPRGLRGRDRRASRAPSSWSSWAREPRPRRACCSTRCTAPARCAATCPST